MSAGETLRFLNAQGVITDVSPENPLPVTGLSGSNSGFATALMSPTEPTAPWDGLEWFDETNGQLKIYQESTLSWITIGPDGTAVTSLNAPLITNVVGSGGAVSNGGSTSDTHFSVTVDIQNSGAVAGDLVRLFDGNSQTGSDYALQSGDVSNHTAAVATSVMALGAHTLTAKLFHAGAPSPASASRSLTIVAGVVTESPEHTASPIADSIVDANLDVWTIRNSDRTVMKNGVAQASTNCLQLWYNSHTVWAFFGDSWLDLTGGSATDGPGWWKDVGAIDPITPTKFTLLTTFGLRVAAGRRVLSFTDDGSGNFIEGIKVNPGDNLQTFASGHAEGTTFCLTKGNYSQQNVTIKNGQRFIGEFDGTTGVTLDGQGIATSAFGGTAAYIHLKNIRVTNYANPTQSAMVHVTGHYNLYESCEFTASTLGAGLYLRPYNMAIACKINDNAQEGYVVNDYDGVALQECRGAMFESCEIGGNNPTNGFWNGSEQGGGKAVVTRQLRYWFCYTHNNNGAAIWNDTNNIDTEVLFCDLLNDEQGIEHEISYNARFAGNRMRGHGNSSTPGFFFAGGAIQIENSQGVASGTYAGFIDIYFNAIVPGVFGRSICYRQQDRGTILANPYSSDPWLLGRIRAHHNDVDMSHGLHDAQVGAQKDFGSIDWATITFDYNTYTTGSNGWWSGPTSQFFEDFATWQSDGLDVHGTATLGAGPPVGNHGTTKWDSSFTNFLTYSDSDYTVTGTDGALDHCTIATTTIGTSDEIYFEVQVKHFSGWHPTIGLGDSSATTDNYPGADTAHSTGLFANNGGFLAATPYAGVLGLFNDGDIIGVYVSGTTHKMWATKDGVTFNGGVIGAQNPTGHVGGVVVPNATLRIMCDVRFGAIASLNPGGSFQLPVAAGYTGIA